MKNMQEMTDMNQQNPPGANQFTTNMPGGAGMFATNMGMMGMGAGMPGMGPGAMNPGMINPGMFMTGAPGGIGGMGMPPGGMSMFNTGMPGMGGAPIGMGGMFGGGPSLGGAGNFGGIPTAPPSFINGPPTSSNMAMQGPGPSIESFQKDGFKILGKEPIKPKNDEGQKEFADLFNLADTKIKDRAHEKPKYDLSYNPNVPITASLISPNQSPPQQSEA